MSHNKAGAQHQSMQVMGVGQLSTPKNAHVYSQNCIYSPDVVEARQLLLQGKTFVRILLSKHQVLAKSTLNASLGLGDCLRLHPDCHGGCLYV